MRLRSAAGVALAIATILAAKSARATNCNNNPSTCVNDDTLWPHAGASRFVGFGGSETVAAGQIGFGLAATYLSRPIVFKARAPGGNDDYAINDQVNGNFLWAFGVTDRFELDVALPVTFGQGGTGVSSITGGDGINDTAMRDMRFGFAYALLPRPRVSPSAPAAANETSPWGVTARLEASAPTGDRDQFAGERAAVFVPSLAADFRSGRFFAGAELGARIRPTAAVLGARVGSQLTVGAGAGYDVLHDEQLSFIGELRALPTLVTQYTGHDAAVGTDWQPDGSALVPAEWHLSARTGAIAGGDLAFQLGGGGGIPLSDSNVTMPRFRVTASIRYAPMMRDSDGDGILDKHDKCPYVPARAIANEPADGCPHETTHGAGDASVPPLRLAAPNDVCTSEPEAVDGFFDDDGCPDEDSDKDGVPNRYDKCPLVAEDFAGLAEGCPEKK